MLEAFTSQLENWRVRQRRHLRLWVPKESVDLHKGQRLLLT